MGKGKVKKSAVKRFWVSGSGKIMRRVSGHGHLLRKKTGARKRNLKKSYPLSSENIQRIKNIIS